MNLSDYIKSERGRGAALAASLGISPSYLSQLAAPGASISPARCVEIEIATGGLVTRQDLRLNDWKRIWPELDGNFPQRRRHRATSAAAPDDNKGD